jgi:hypothetical protein
MKSESIKHYSLICIAFMIIISVLIYLNMKAVKLVELNRRYEKLIVSAKSSKIKEYGYSEALEVLSKVPNLNINSFNNNIDNKKLLKVELEYNGDIDSFIKIIKSLKEEDNYYNIDNIKVENISVDKKIIKFNVLLIKNR